MVAFVSNWLLFSVLGQDVTLPPELPREAGERLDLQKPAAEANR
jgi:hypothetical protein